MKSEHGRSMTLECVRAALIQLGCHLPAIGIDETYSIDLKSFIELAQNEEAESIVLKRYGREAYRMFRLLSKAGHLIETDKGVLQRLLLWLWSLVALIMESFVAFGHALRGYFRSLWAFVLSDSVGLRRISALVFAMYGSGLSFSSLGR
ncbi:hypothetical protein U1Q18_031614 [Sarracenia purpurea var. burkii]